MTQPTVLELAQNGDPQAIATLMNRTLHAQGMNARVARQGDRIMVMTEAEQVPNRMLMTNFVRNGINGLNLNDSIRIVRILGKKKGAEQPAWVQELELSAPAAATAEPAVEPELDDEPETSNLSQDAQDNEPSVTSDRPTADVRPVPPPPMGRMQVPDVPPPPPTPPHELIAESPAAESPAAPPRPVPPPPPPPSMAGLDDEMDEMGDEADISLDSTILPGLDSEFPSSGFNEPLAEEEDISFDLQSVGEPVEAAEPNQNNERLSDRLLDDEPISLDLNEDEALIDVPDEVLRRIVHQNGADNGNVAAPDDLYDGNGINETNEPHDLDELDDPNEPDDLDEPDRTDGSSDDSLSSSEDEEGDYGAEQPDSAPPLLAPAAEPAALPEGTDSDPGVEEPRSPGRRVGAIFAAVSVVLVAWIAGILGYSVWQTANSPESGSESTAVFIPDNDANGDAPPEPSADGQPTEPAEAYDTAVELANRADGLMANARSQDDWNLAVAQWQRVIGLLEQVPQDDPNYEPAQAALTNARQALDIAQTGADQPLASNALPATRVRIAGGEVCEGVRSTQESPPIELTNVQLDEPASPNSATYFLGCITNHTDQIIDTVQITYATSADPAATAQGALNLRNLAPGQTIPFSSNFTLNPGTTDVTITNITWTVSGATEPQALNTSLSVSQSLDG